jgi:hypothetical protein
MAVLISILISGRIHLTMAPGGIMSEDDEEGTEAMELAGGTEDTDRVTAINGSGCHLKGHRNNRCCSMCRLLLRYRSSNGSGYSLMGHHNSMCRLLMYSSQD